MQEVVVYFVQEVVVYFVHAFSNTEISSELTSNCSAGDLTIIFLIKNKKKSMIFLFIWFSLLIETIFC